MRKPCDTGYTCPACRRRYDRDPAGTDAWWFRCECGALAEPTTKAEAAEQPDLFGAEVQT